MNEDKEILVEEYTGEDREDDYIELKEEGIIVIDEPTDNIEDSRSDTSLTIKSCHLLRHSRCSDAYNNNEFISSSFSTCSGW